MVAVSEIPWLAPARSALAALAARGVHAMLLHGPSGTGKWNLALSFARDVLCEQARPPAPACGHCHSCLLFAAGNHPDLRVTVPDALAHRRPAPSTEEAEEGAVEGEEAGREGGRTKARPSREIRLVQVQELAALAGLSAHRGGTRVVVLGPAESLNDESANALLKGLEEPPPDSLFVLVSDQLDRCLPTIVSRCALVRVALPAQEAALAWLQAQGLASTMAATRLAAAGGAPLRALADDAAQSEGEVLATLLGLLRRGPTLTPAEVAAAVPRTVVIGSAVDLFQRWAWDYFSYRLGGTVRYHPDAVASFTALSRHWSSQAAGAWVDSLLSLKAVAEHPLNARSAVEGALLEYISSVSGPGAGNCQA